MKKKILIILIAACTMLFAFGMINASAAIVDSGSCGNNLTWTLDDSETLVITGSGNMYNWTNCRYVPWYSNSSKIKKVVIEDGVTSIGDDAFLECTKLESVIFGKDITSIGNYAFGNCSMLETNIVLGNNITSIGQGAFSSCSKLTRITIGENVTIIEKGAFTSCISLIQINWNAKNVADFSSYNNNVFNRAGQNGEGITVIFGDEVESIPAYCFYPHSGSNIPNIANISIGKNIKQIGDSAFYNTTFYNNTTNWENGVLCIDDCLINVDSSVTELEIISDIQCIAEDAFEDASSLETLHIKNPNKWCEINQLTDEYGNYLIYDVEKIFYDGDKVTTRITLDDTVTKIPAYAFYNCADLQTIAMSDSVKSVGDYAFYGCTTLIRATMSDEITAIGEYAFSGCSSLFGFNMPQKVQTIGRYAFDDCSSLTSIDIPSTLVSVGNGAFSGCSKLSDIYITDVGAWCNIDFSDFNSNPGGNLYVNDALLDTVVIPSGITEIKQFAFSGAKNIKTVVIPEGVTKIGDSAFEDCTGLLNITLPSTLKTVEADAFNAYIRNLITNIYITDLEAWCNIDFGDAQSNPLYIADNLYLNGKLITDLVIPDTVTRIKANQFIDAFCLKSVILHDKVETIEDNAFNECLNLKYIVIPEDIFYIKNDAFTYCNNLQYVFYKGSQTMWDDMLIYGGNDPLNNATVICNAIEKTYKFETNCDSNLKDITTYCLLETPKPYNEKQVLAGWYDNAALSGEAIVFPYYGDVTTLYAKWTERTGESFNDAFYIKENEKITKTVDAWDYVYYEFSPCFSGEYKFYITGSSDVYINLYNQHHDYIAYNNNGEYYSYSYFEAGETYYLSLRSSITDEISLSIKTDITAGTSTEVSQDGNHFTINVNGIPSGKEIILALYNGDKFVGLQHATYIGNEIHFTTDESYTNAKVMVWDDLVSLKPECSPEIVK